MLRRPKLVIASGLAAAVLGLVVWLVHIMSSPSEGVVISHPTQPAQPQLLPTPAAKTYADAFVSFRYPGTFNRVTTPDAKSYNDAVTLVGGVGSAARLAVTVRPAEDLASDPSVHFRTTSGYARQSVVINGATGLLFTSASQFEQTAYVAAAGHTYTISLSDPQNHDLSSEFRLISQSFAWK